MDHSFLLIVLAIVSVCAVTLVAMLAILVGAHFKSRLTPSGGFDVQVEPDSRKAHGGEEAAEAET